MFVVEKRLFFYCFIYEIVVGGNIITGVENWIDHVGYGTVVFTECPANVLVNGTYTLFAAGIEWIRSIRWECVCCCLLSC